MKNLASILEKDNNKNSQLPLIFFNVVQIDSLLFEKRNNKHIYIEEKNEYYNCSQYNTYQENIISKIF